VFDGYTDSDFDNVITGLNDIEVVNQGNVIMTAAGYALGDSEITVDSESLLTVSGDISGAGSLIKVGMGELVLSGAKTRTGSTTVSAGTLSLLNNTAAGTGQISIAAATLEAGADNLDIANAIALTAAGSSVTTGDFNTTLSGTVSGAGGLTKTGSGKLTLTLANTYTGGTTVSAGTLSLLNNAAAGTGQISIGAATLEAGANNLSIGNAVVLNSTNSTLATGSFNTTLSGLISGSGQLVKSGGGELSLTGANSYSGGTSVTAGVLALGSGVSAGTGTIALSAGTTLQTNAAMTLANAISVAGNSTLATGGNAVTASGVVSGSGKLIKTGTGALTLRGSNTYTDGTQLQAGTIVAASDSALGTGSLEAAGSGVVLAAGKTNLTLTNAVTLTNDLIVDTAGELVLLRGDVSGSGKLIKRGSGTLELAGSNSYAGGTEVEQGTLALDLNSAVSTGEVVMAADTVVQAGTTLALSNVFKLRGPVQFNTQGFDLTLNGAVSNNSVGQLIKTGSGTLTLNGANDYTGGTIIEQGTLALYGTLASFVEVDAGATLGGTGTITGDVTNAGLIQPRLNGTRSTLTVIGNYVGNNGTFASTLGGTSAAIEADQLAIQGAGNTASGSTRITVADPTGVLGKPTVGDGILLVGVTAGATSTATAFNAPRIAAGAYEYTLEQGGESSTQSWYLRADIDEPQPPVIITPEAAQREEVALYPSLPSLARQYLWSINGTLDDRRGSPDVIGQWDKQPIAWGRIIAQGNETKPGNVNDGPGLKATDWGLQLGADLWRSNSDWGQWRMGPVATIGRSTGNASNSTGSVNTGGISLNAYSLGLNATVASQAGAYADLLLLGTRLTGVEANSPLGTGINTTGWAFSGSLEGGWRVPMTSKLAITPQAQVYATTVNLQDATDAYSLIEMPTQTTTLGRLGVKLSYDHMTDQGPRTQFWARASVFSTLSGKDAPTSFLNLAGTNPTTFQSQAPSTWMAIDAAVNVQATKATSIQVGLGYQTSFNSQYRGVFGQVNVRFAF
jgi:outer membrane autotransporter protein